MTTYYVVLTFDDGIKEYSLYASSILYKKDILATFFLITSLQKHPYLDKQLVDKHDIIKIHDMGHEIASHSATHRDLTILGSNDLLYELKNSKDFLEEIIKDEVKGFAYPYGKYTNRVISYVKKFYKYARTIHLRSIKTCDINDPFNNKYKLCGISPKLFLYILLRDWTINVNKNHIYIIVFHEEVKLLNLLLNLLGTFSVRFLQLKDLVKYIDHKDL